MVRKTTVFILLISMVALSGCATTRKQNDLERQGLRNQISVLQSQVQSKDEEINSLKENLAKAAQEKGAPEPAYSEFTGKKKNIHISKSHPSTREIQAALKNAGFDSGTIDGKMGKQTRDAIKAFQKANNLVVNGKAGKKTWKLLREYLEKKVK